MATSGALHPMGSSNVGGPVPTPSVERAFGIQGARELIANLTKVFLRAALITATRLNQHGASPLHLAIVRGLSDAWLRRLLWAHRLAASVQDNDGRMTPLHVALRYRRTSVGTVRLLVDSHPAALVARTRKGFIPLHVASEFTSSVDVLCLLLNLHPEGISARTLAGDTPLHLACGADRPCGDEIVLTLIDREPRVLKFRNREGQTPLSILCGIWDEYAASSEGRAQIDAVEHASDMDGLLRRLWNKIRYLAKALYCLVEDITMSSSTLLSDRFLPHAAIGAGCPSSFIRLVLRLHPDQALERDRTLRLPLAIAASATFRSNQEALETIEEIIRDHPEAAADPDSCGKYPLHLAVDSKKTWDHGVRSIFVAYPDVIDVTDVSSRMYPFMVAAKAKDAAQSLPGTTLPSELDFGPRPRRGSIRSRSDSFDEYEPSLHNLFGNPSMRFWDEDLDSDSDAESIAEEQQQGECAVSSQITKQKEGGGGELPGSSPGARESEVAQIDTVYNLLRSGPCTLQHAIAAPWSL